MTPLDVLCEIGRLTRWVGHLELEAERPGSVPPQVLRSAAEDMRAIQQLATDATGWEFSEYT